MRTPQIFGSITILKRQNLFTSAGGADIPVLEKVGSAVSIPHAADQIRAWHDADDVPENTYFLQEAE
ncbi:hypothetical protein GCM10011316_21660 [Roseibium aquae]|uniref:Uncharacterized protein n=2 Tax=Roseibium aquae TaxID=1323746 RepID=A0A916TKK8_9HYPH|nr:hypothetical protein GCM10011316_21660 [Roseibium aquae]